MVWMTFPGSLPSCDSVLYSTSSFTPALETLSGAELFPALGLRSKGGKEELQKSPDVFAHFLRLFAFHIDGQLHFTDITFGWQHSHYTRQLSALSTLSSIISDSFEFLLAASMHKFHKR